MSNVSLLRFSYWIGAILDLLLGVMMIVPFVFGLLAGIPSFSPGSDYLYAGAMAGVMLFGWTALLLWADRDPVARKDVLLITVFPVLAGLIINDFLGLTSGFLPLTATLLFLGIQVFLVILFLFAYFKAERE